MKIKLLLQYPSITISKESRLATNTMRCYPVHTQFFLFREDVRLWSSEPFTCLSFSTHIVISYGKFLLYTTFYCTLNLVYYFVTFCMALYATDVKTLVCIIHMHPTVLYETIVLYGFYASITKFFKIPIRKNKYL